MSGTPRVPLLTPGPDAISVVNNDSRPRDRRRESPADARLRVRWRQWSGYSSVGVACDVEGAPSGGISRSWASAVWGGVDALQYIIAVRRCRRRHRGASDPRAPERIVRELGEWCDAHV